MFSPAHPLFSHKQTGGCKKYRTPPRQTAHCNIKGECDLKARDIRYAFFFMFPSQGYVTQNSGPSCCRMKFGGSSVTIFRFRQSFMAHRSHPSLHRFKHERTASWLLYERSWITRTSHLRYVIYHCAETTHRPSIYDSSMKEVCDVCRARLGLYDRTLSKDTRRRGVRIPHPALAPRKVEEPLTCVARVFKIRLGRFHLFCSASLHPIPWNFARACFLQYSRLRVVEVVQCC